MKTKACDVRIVQTPRYLQQLQDPGALAGVTSPDPACLAGSIKLFESFVPDAANHSSQL